MNLHELVRLVERSLIWHTVGDMLRGLPFLALATILLLAIAVTLARAGRRPH